MHELFSAVLHIGCQLAQQCFTQSNIRFTWFEILFQVRQVLMCTCSPLTVLHNDLFRLSNKMRMMCHSQQLCSKHQRIRFMQHVMF